MYQQIILEISRDTIKILRILKIKIPTKRGIWNLEVSRVYGRVAKKLELKKNFNEHKFKSKIHQRIQKFLQSLRIFVNKKKKRCLTQLDEHVVQFDSNEIRMNERAEREVSI